MTTHAYDAALLTLAAQYSSQAGIPPTQLAALAKGIVYAESNFNPSAYRAEPQINDASRGLMQVLGRTARALGYTGALGDDTTHSGGLYDESTNLKLGVALLAQNLERASGSALQRIPVAVSAYNAGWSSQRPTDAQRTASGAFVNQAYVDRVLSAYRGYVGDFPPAGNGVTAPAEGVGVMDVRPLIIVLGGSAVVFALLKALRVL